MRNKPGTFTRPISTCLMRCLIVLAANASMLSAVLAQTLIWSEEFNTGSAPNPQVWTAETGNGSQYGIPGWGNGELQNYTGDAANVRVDNGNLVITALRSGNDFTSARIKTQNKLTFQYGTVEARIKTPDLANGLWPAFWTLGNLWTQGENWPTCGEIDVMEMGSGAAITAGKINARVGSAIHAASLSGTVRSGYLDVAPDIDDTFVIYRMVWTPTTITTYIDGQQIWSRSISGVPEFHKPHFFILNLAVGGTYTGITGSNIGNITASFPAEYAVDWIRIYDYGDTVLGGTYSNTPPVFTTDPINKPNTDQNSAYSGTLAGSATDADTNDTLTYSKVPASGPAWLNVAPNGALSGTPGNADVGLNSWTVQVSDGNGGTDTATLNITVNDVNDDPVFAFDPINKPNAFEETPYSASIAGSATDVDAGDTLSYSLVPGGPAWLNVATNGALYGTPATADVGLNSWTVQVSDGNGGTDTATLRITVLKINDDPVFTVDPIIRPDTDDSLYPGTSFYTNTIAGSAMDADPGDTLTYSRVSGPTWLEVQPNGDIWGFTSGVAPGLNSWIVQVSDGDGGTDTATLQIWVGSAPSTPPAVSIQVSGSDLAILWPASATGFSLYGTTNLLSPVSWTTVTNIPVVQGDDWMVSLPIVGAPDFFRLQNP